ncbi:MAG: peptide chain release factor N(5)-glutamine methyltransferase [Anaerolineae bacterium]|nr:peptide chain release factor N(5)-glutamine methyltransferase [Anaerolineae bacterium]
MTTIADTLKQAIASLMGVSGSPRLDAEMILAHVIEKPREYLIAHGEVTLDTPSASTYAKLLTLRRKGMPVAYILGKRGFFDRDFRVNSHVLIPRPETEHVVESALSWAQGRGKLHIIDIGTGSGVIALSIAAKLSESSVIASDVSAAALLVARENGLGLNNVTYLQSDLLAGIVGTFDIICANLPYIATGELNLLEVAKFEPHVALDGGSDGLLLIRRLLDQAPTRLRRPGLMLLEMGADQGEAVAGLARSAFPQAQVSIIKDYAKLDRVVRIEIV